MKYVDLLRLIKSDYIRSSRITGNDDISLIDLIKFYFIDSGFRLGLLYRLSRYFYLRNTKMSRKISLFIHQHEVRITSSSISPLCEIGEGLIFSYGIGVVIAKSVEIGKNAYVLNGVSLGSAIPHVTQKIYIGDNVFIGTGAKVLGEITLGENVKVGANAVVLKNFGSDVTLVGAPAKQVKKS